VAEIDFADGFDVPEPLAWGLTPAQLGTALVGAVLAYLVLHSPLPRIAAVPLAVIAVATGLTLALARREGRTLIAWAAVAARFWARPRRGLLVVVNMRDDLPQSPRHETMAVSAPQDSRSPSAARPGWATGAREVGPRVPLVLLPEPVERSREHRAEAVATGARPLPILSVADAALLDAPARRAGPDADATVGAPSGHDPVFPGIGPTPALRATRRLTFFSLSGGTGRTTLAVEVAGLLAGQAHGGNAGRALAPPRVALVDLDLMSPRAGIRLGVPTPTDWDLAEAEPLAPAVERLLAVHSSGLRVLPGPARLLPTCWSDRPDLVRRLAAAVGALETWGCDTIVLDVAGDLSALSRWALESAHDIFVVLTPTAGGVHDAYRSTEALRRLGLRRRLRYVVNRSHGEPVVTEAMLDLGGTVVAEIPDDPDLELAEMEHRLLGLESSGQTAAALRALAATIDTRFLAPGRRAPSPAARRILRRRAG
jgi:MinD-like ATPase involved in chromosome partitioning or flagellar assembly